MILKTPHADIEVLGTMFSAGVQGARTDLHVKEGRVRIQNKSSGELREISTGQACEIFADAEHIYNVLPEKDPALMCWWRFDEMKGFRLMDSAGKNPAGEISGAEWSAGRFGGALRFKKETDHVVIENMVLKDISQGTLAFWVKGYHESLSSKVFIMSMYIKKGDYSAKLLMDHSAKGIIGHFLIKSGSKVLARFNIGGSFVLDGSWHHVALTYNDAERSIYVDGEQKQFPCEDTYTYDSPNQKTDESIMLIGLDTSAKGRLRNLSGSLDDIRFYTRVLTKEEVCELSSGFHVQDADF
jgi:hypothetical protein